MAVSMTFYSGFSKRENSTKQPTGGTAYSVVFKDAFSLIGGTVKLQANFDVAKNYTAASYGSKYYTIVDVVSISNGIVEITLSLDVLATYKSEIGAYKSLMQRSPNSDEISFLPDDTIAPLHIHTKKQVDASVFSIGVSFQIKTKNGNGDLAYFLDLAGFNNLLSKFEAAFWTDETKYIVSTKVVTIQASACGGTAVSAVYIGNQNYNVTEGHCYALKAQSYIALNSKTVSFTSFGLTYTDERRFNNRYVSIQCKMNGDVFDIDSSFLRYSNFIVESFIDPMTLDVRVEVGAVFEGESYLIASTQTNIGIGFMFTDVPNSLDTIVSTLSGIGKIDKSSLDRKTKQLKPDADFGKIASILPRGYQAGMETHTTGAPSGSSIAAVMYGEVIFYITENFSTSKNESELGYPYAELRSINELNLTGFYKFSYPQLGLAATSDIKSKVNAYLANGFFYE